MTYKVIKDFTDLKAGGRIYRKGDAFSASEERLEELSGTTNKRKEPVIEEVKTKTKKKANKDK